MKKIRLVNLPWLKVQFQFEIRDLWVGLFWRYSDIAVHIYVCIIPTIPLHISYLRKKARIMYQYNPHLPW